MPSDNDRLLMMSKGKSIGCGCLIIPGPLEAYNMDKPVKVLSHFHDSWRYYWVMEYLDRGAWRWGIVSVIFIILRKVFFLARRRNGGTSGKALATVMGEGEALATVMGKEER